MNSIEINGLTKYYGKSRGIINLDLSVSDGEFFGFIGPNGAGKSTTINILLGLIKQSCGEAKIFGKDIVKNKTDVLANIGYIPSEAIFYRGMRVKDVIKFSASLRKADCNKEAKVLCERLNLDTSKRVEELSFGNRKKLAIICALQHNPRLLIFDEPTSGLDPLIQKEFFTIIREKNKQGITVFMSSHILSEIQQNCSRAAIINEGTLIACGSIESLSKTNAKRINIEGDIDILSLTNIRDIQKTDEGISFLYSGDINIILKMLSKNKIKDLTVTEPNLEEIFMHFYSGGKQI